jgi:hypothetical protein
MKEFERLLKDGTIAFYEYTKTQLPDFVYTKTQGTVGLFSKDVHSYDIGTSGIQIARYSSLSEMRERQTDVYFLDGNAVKILFAKFPVTSRYLCIRLVPRLSWAVAFLGLLRRLYIGLIKVEGITTLSINGKKQHWLVLEHLLSKSLQTRYSISEDVGVEGFLNHLRNEQINYVVLRFYEKLPQVYRNGGDIDILVSDEDEHKIRSFLQKHPGKLGVDVWTPSRTSHNSITYYPPPLARKIVASAIEGPGGARIPSPKEAFIGFAYHAIYHKGVFAGVPTSLSGLVVNQHPENDYTKVLREMAVVAGVTVDITMEALDEYLAEEGWQPKTDTLAKIAPWNKWVQRRFFSTYSTKEIGLSVFILKKRAFLDGVADKILEMLHTQNGFTVLRVKKFTDKEIKHVTDHLRGGVWNDVSGSVDDFLPAMAVVVLDTQFARASHISAKQVRPDKGITDMKKVLRKKFDTAKVSSIHSTDTTHEAWEYIDECFFQERKEIEDAVSIAIAKMKTSFMEQILLYVRAVPHTTVFYYARHKRRLMGKLVEWLVG